jgi:hypothetical protein
MDPQTLITVILGFLASAGLLWLVCIWLLCRDFRRTRRWALQRQLWEMEDQIWLESLPDWLREAMIRGREQRAAITQEARRCLGLPEENPP